MEVILRGLSLVIFSFIIFVLLLILHIHQHFRIRCCIHSKNSILHNNSSAASNEQRNSLRNSLRVHSGNLIRQIKRNQSICRSCLVGVDDDFDFFPISFLLYLLFIIIILIIIICRYCIYNNNNSNYMINHNSMTTIDWIIVYLLIFLSIWESLFNFYRFYSTYHVSRKIVILTTKQIISKYILIFGLPFLCIFIFQIHFYYYLYPVIIILYFVFNISTVWLFGHILIVQYRFVMGNEVYLSNIQNDMLSSVYLMRRISLISVLSSTIYIILFTYSYNVNIILFVPILWLISCIGLTFNFVRNRQFIYKNWLKFKLYYYRLPCTLKTKTKTKTKNKNKNKNKNDKTKDVIKTNSEEPLQPPQALCVQLQESKLSNNQQKQHKSPSSNKSRSKNGTSPHQHLENAKPILKKIDSGDEMDNYHENDTEIKKTDPSPTKIIINILSNPSHSHSPSNPSINSSKSLNINNNNNNNNNTPSMIMAATTPHQHQQHQQQQQQQISSSHYNPYGLQLTNSPKSISKSTSKHKWFHNIKNKIPTPSAHSPNLHMFGMTTLSPIMVPHSPNNAMVYDGNGLIDDINHQNCSNEINAVASPNTRRQKAMKFLGIATMDGNHGMVDINNKFPKYIPPTTPMPYLFDHLISVPPTHQFPEPPQMQQVITEEKYDNDDNVEEEEYDDDSIGIMVKNDEKDEEDEYYDDTKMNDMMNKHDENNLIRVSRNKPNLTIHRISTKLDTPPILTNRSPFLAAIKNKKKYKITHKQNDLNTPLSSIIDDNDNKQDPHIIMAQYESPSFSEEKKDEEEEEKEEEEEEENFDIDIDIEKNNDTKIGALQSLKIHSLNKLKIHYSPKKIRRIRSKSDNHQSEHVVNNVIDNDEMIKTSKSMQTDKTNAESPNAPHVVEVFKVLAHHGFYSNTNVNAAQQLREYAQQYN